MAGESTPIDQSESKEQARRILASIQILRRYVMNRHAEAMALREQNGISYPELTLPQTRLLFTVRERRQATVKELAEALSVSPPSVSTMVERLVELGVLTREQSTVDRREVIIRIPEAFETALDGLERYMLEAISGILKDIGPEYGRMWCEVYEKICPVVLAQDQKCTAHGAGSED